MPVFWLKLWVNSQDIYDKRSASRLKYYLEMTNIEEYLREIPVLFELK